MNNIDEIMKMLDWNNPPEIQEKGVELGKEINSINVFIRPKHRNCYKNVWDNCALILASQTDEALYPYVLNLIEWVEDENWPGAETILARLKCFSDTGMLSRGIEMAVKKAVATDYSNWLGQIAKLLDNEKLKAELREDTLEVLSKYRFAIIGDFRSIKDILDMLDWHNPLDVQEKGIELARNLEDLSPLILPCIDDESKALLWDNCARALYEIPDDRLEPYLPSLLEWLQDFNWPGSLIILDRLKIYKGEKLGEPFLELVNYAKNLSNEEGLMWLDNLSELLDNISIRNSLSSEIVDMLTKHYHNWGWWYDDESGQILV